MPGCLLIGRGSSQLEATKDSLDTKLEDECARIGRDVVEKHGDCVARHVGDVGKQTRSCLLGGLCRPMWEQP